MTGDGSAKGQIRLARMTIHSQQVPALRYECDYAIYAPNPCIPPSRPKPLSL